jgi:L-Ala-D/L-Glu epimerase
MKIKSFEIWQQDLGNTRPYTIAFKTVDKVLNNFLQITLEDGTTGIGCGNPSEYVTGESFQSLVETLTEENLEFLKGRDIREITGLLSEAFIRFPKNPAARAAVDIALYDAFTKHIGVPLGVYLGQKIKSLPTSVTIGIKSVADTLEEAQEYWDMGHRVLKVKLGKDLHEDIERMAKLREVFGSQIVIRVDANQGYDFEETIEFFKRTEKFDIELVEQPMKAKAFDDMRNLPEPMKAKVAADESCISMKDALSLTSGHNASGIFNIKLMKTGGVFQALKIADVALNSGVELMWGCNDESAISITAALHAALSYPNTKYLDLDGSLDMAHDVVTGGFHIENGWMTITDKPGLGLTRV